MQENEIKTASLYNLLEVKLNDSHPHAYKPHLHSELAIGVIEKGTSILNIDDVDYRINEGEAVIIMPYVVHNCQPLDINNWAFTMIYLGDSFKEELVSQLDETLIIGIAKLGQKEFKMIKNLADLLKTERSNFVKEVEIIDCLNTIIASIKTRVSKEIDGEVERVKNYILEHFLDELMLDELSSMFKINKFTLIRRFKKRYNSTPSAYQLQLKVDYAKQLMKKTDNVTDVALKAGFYDQAHFTREFKKATGLTPKKYISQLNIKTH